MAKAGRAKAGRRGRNNISSDVCQKLCPKPPKPFHSQLVLLWAGKGFFTSCKQQCACYKRQWSVEWGERQTPVCVTGSSPPCIKDTGEMGKGETSHWVTSLYPEPAHSFSSGWELWPCTGTRTLLVVIVRHPLLPHSQYPCIHPPPGSSPPACPESEFSCRLAVCMQTVSYCHFSQIHEMWIKAHKCKVNVSNLRLRNTNWPI